MVNVCVAAGMAASIVSVIASLSDAEYTGKNRVHMFCVIAKVEQRLQFIIR